LTVQLLGFAVPTLNLDGAGESVDTLKGHGMIVPDYLLPLGNYLTV
jgi:hypothetical protein